MEKRFEQYKLSRYAAQYWADHVRGGLEKDVEIQKSIIQTFRSLDSREAMDQIKIYAESTLGKFEVSMARSLLHIVAANGLATVCRCLLDGIYNDDGRYVQSFLRT